jgi:hypothetical protein
MAYLPICFLFVGPQAVHAQSAVRAPLVAVMDLSNDTSYGGSDVGRTAADALVNELSNSGKFDVETRSDVDQGLNNLGLTPPLDSIDIQRLGKQLQVDAIVTGEVLSISRPGNGKQVEAVVVIRMTDSISGELINGSLAQGTSTPREGAVADDDVLVDQAIGKAMFAAVRQMNNYNLPKATIMSNESTDTVLLNKGSRDGLTVGLNMVVNRGDQTIGHVKVTSIEPDESYALITDQGEGIRPQDVATGVFTLPAYSVHGNTVVTDADISSGTAVQATRHSTFQGIGGVILALLAAALLVSLVNRGSNSGSLGGGTTSSVTAQAIYGGAYSLPYNTVSVVQDFAEIELESPQSYASLIKWGTGNLNPRYIVSFNIYRDG